MLPIGTILELYIGEPTAHWDGEPPSAIAKRPVSRPIEVTKTGLAGDRQADMTVHGGPEKAIHHYVSEHYAFWLEQFPEHTSAFRVGGFGENISSEGFTEEDLCIGDILTAGTARLQISQGRQPCWKLSRHTNNPAMAPAFQKSARTGWYYRVIEEGIIQPGDSLAVIERPCPDWNLSAVIKARFNPRLDPGTAKALSELEELAEPWRTAFAKKADPAFVEDTSRRLRN